MSKTQNDQPLVISQDSVEDVKVSPATRKVTGYGAIKNDGTATVPLIPYTLDSKAPLAKRDGVIRGHLIVGKSGQKYLVAVMPIDGEVHPIDAKTDGTLRKQYTLEQAWLETDFTLPKGSPDMEYLEGKFVPIEGKTIFLQIRATTDNLVITEADQKKKGKPGRPSVRF